LLDVNVVHGVNPLLLPNTREDGGATIAPIATLRSQTEIGERHNACTEFLPYGNCFPRPRCERGK
jgi:hypothetical protein